MSVLTRFRFIARLLPMKIHQNHLVPYSKEKKWQRIIWIYAFCYGKIYSLLDFLFETIKVSQIYKSFFYRLKTLPLNTSSIGLIDVKKKNISSPCFFHTQHLLDAEEKGISFNTHFLKSVQVLLLITKKIFNCNKLSSWKSTFPLFIGLVIYNFLNLPPKVTYETIRNLHVIITLAFVLQARNRPCMKKQ